LSKFDDRERAVVVAASDARETPGLFSKRLFQRLSRPSAKWAAKAW
jgi:hypothetical protein